MLVTLPTAPMAAKNSNKELLLGPMFYFRIAVRHRVDSESKSLE